MKTENKADEMVVYSANGEDFNDTEVNDVIQTIVSYLESEDDWHVGAEFSYHKAEAVCFKPEDFIDVDDVLENMQFRADDEGGEYAEDFTYCDKEARDELQSLLESWANKHLDCHFYRVRNSEEVSFIVDEDMYNDFK